MSFSQTLSQASDIVRGNQIIGASRVECVVVFRCCWLKYWSTSWTLEDGSPCGRGLSVSLVLDRVVMPLVRFEQFLHHYTVNRKTCPNNLLLLDYQML